MAELVAEGRDAARGLMDLLRRRPAWSERFALTTDGFVRSFAAPLAALPLSVADTAIYHRAVEAPLGAAALASATIAHLLDTFGYPVLLAALAAPLRYKPGYASFVIVNNWATLFMNALLTLAAPLALAGGNGVAVFTWIALALVCLSVALTWRIARETLTHELAPCVLVVVLSLGWSTLAERIAQAALGA